MVAQTVDALLRGHFDVSPSRPMTRAAS